MRDAAAQLPRFISGRSSYKKCPRRLPHPSYAADDRLHSSGRRAFLLCRGSQALEISRVATPSPTARNHSPRHSVARMLRCWYRRSRWPHRDPFVEAIHAMSRPSTSSTMGYGAAPGSSCSGHWMLSRVQTWTTPSMTLVAGWPSPQATFPAARHLRQPLPGTHRHCAAAPRCSPAI